MRGTIEQSAFQSAINLVQGIAQTKIANPIVENTVLKMGADALEVLATNLSVSIRVRLTVENAKPGEIALPAKLLSQVVRELPGGPVELSLSGSELKIQAGRSKFNLNGMTTEDFPPFLPNVQGPEIEIPAPVAALALERTAFSTTDERARYQLGGVKFFHEAGKVTWVATDGRRMSRVVHEIEDLSGPKCTMLVPARTVQEVVRALPDSGNLKMTVGEKRVLFESGETTIASTLLDDNFPPYQALIPSSYQIRITLDRDELLAAVRRASVLTTDRSKLVVLAAKNDTLVVTGERLEAGGATSEIDATTNGQSAVASYNAIFLIECLRVMGAGKVVWSLQNDGGPAYLTKEEDDSFLHIIMPMTVRDDADRAEEPSDAEEEEESEEDA